MNKETKSNQRNENVSRDDQGTSDTQSITTEQRSKENGEVQSNQQIAGNRKARRTQKLSQRPATSQIRCGQKVDGNQTIRNSQPRNKRILVRNQNLREQDNLNVSQAVDTEGRVSRVLSTKQIVPNRQGPQVNEKVRSNKQAADNQVRDRQDVKNPQDGRKTGNDHHSRIANRLRNGHLVRKCKTIKNHTVQDSTADQQAHSSQAAKNSQSEYKKSLIEESNIADTQKNIESRNTINIGKFF